MLPNKIVFNNGLFFPLENVTISNVQIVKANIVNILKEV